MTPLNYNKESLKEICEKYGLSLLILHGSYVKGTAIFTSDIDIALLGEPQLIKEKYFDILGDFSSLFGDKFDPVFLNGAEAMITYQVAKCGVPLYEKTKGLFNSFKVAALARYQDSRKFRVLEERYIKMAIKQQCEITDKEK